MQLKKYPRRICPPAGYFVDEAKAEEFDKQFPPPKEGKTPRANFRLMNARFYDIKNIPRPDCFNIFSNKCNPKHFPKPKHKEN